MDGAGMGNFNRGKKMRLVLGLALAAGLVLAAFFAPLFATHDPHEANPNNLLCPPCREHYFGTDRLGRDIFSRVLYGGRTSLAVGISAAVLAVGSGTALGALAGYYGGFIDAVFMRLADMVLVLPTIFLVLLLVSLFEPELWLVVVVIGGTGWPGTARLVRGEFLRLREADYVASAQMLGASNARIILRHMLPNALGPVLVSASLAVPAALLTEAGLGYFGLGVQPSVPTWGNMLRDAQLYLRHAWWYATFPGLSVFLTVFAFHLLADGLLERFENRPRGKIWHA